MDWSLLLLLACPLMMVFCMKGMFMGNKDKKKNEKAVANTSPATEQDIQSLQIQMADLMEENKKLEREIKTIKSENEHHSDTTTLKAIK